MNDQLELGELLKGAGMSTALASASEDYKQRFDALLHLRAKTHERFTVEDICAVVGRPPGSPNVCGALINAAARRGLIRCVDRVKATRASLHASELKVWVGA